MNWGQPDFLDSRTWISTLPDDIISHLSEYGEEETERVLTKFGPSEWIKALCNQEIMPAKKIRKQGWQSLFPVESLTEEDVLSLAIYWTRCQMCIKLSTETEIFQTSIPAKNSRNELDYAGIKAAKLLTEPPRWAIPFDHRGYFLWSTWRQAGHREQFYISASNSQPGGGSVVDINCPSCLMPNQYSRLEGQPHKCVRCGTVLPL